MKKVIGGVLFFGCVLAAVPVVNGVIMEKTIRQAASELNNQTPPQDYSMEIMRYERGLFSSDIQWKINLGEMHRIDDIDSVIFTDHATHGITGVTSTSSFDKNIWFTKFVDSQLAGENPFTLTTRYTLLGGIQTSLHCTDFTLELRDEILQIKGGSLSLDYDTAMEHFAFQGNWRGLKVAQKTSLGLVHLSGEFERLSPYIFQGSANYSMENATITDQRGMHLDLERASGAYSLKVDPDRDTLAVTLSFSLGKFLSSQSEVNEARGSFTLENLDRMRYHNFIQAYDGIVRSSFPLLNQGGEPQSMSREAQLHLSNTGLKLVAAFEELFQKGMRIKVEDIHVDLPEGTVSGNVLVELLRDMTLMQFAPVVGQPAFILDILHLDSTLDIPTEVLPDNQLLLTPFYPGMKTGLFTEKGKYLHHRAITRNGSLYLNDERVDLGKR